MRSQNLPAPDSRYWVAMAIASIVGTTAGDFFSGDLGLGFLKGLSPLGLALVTILFVEARTPVANTLYYWLAIIVTRAAATNLADLATHAFKIDYAWIAAILAALLVATSLVGRYGALSSRIGPGSHLPATNARYWIMVLIASTLGTVLGDFMADGLGLGVVKAALILVVVFVGALVRLSRIADLLPAEYWFVIVIVRTLGTVTGDWLSAGDGGLGLGSFISACGSAAFLAIFVRLALRRRAALSESPIPVGQAESSVTFSRKKQ